MSGALALGSLNLVTFVARLKELVEYGPPPGKTGAKYIIREDGQRLDLRYLKKSSDHHLELGYKANIPFVLLMIVYRVSFMFQHKYVCS